jgi:hypothetical protein
MNEKETDARETDDEQSLWIAHFLGTTVDKLCPALKNHTVYLILNYEELQHSMAIKYFTDTSNHYVLPQTDGYGAANYIRMSTPKISREDVTEFWNRLVFAVQYGYEHGVKADIVDKNKFQLMPSAIGYGDFSAVYDDAINKILTYPITLVVYSVLQSA